MRALLTFDDGPGEATEPLLDLLGEHGVRAAFFLVGKQVRKRPETVARIAREGHILGNHSWDHPDLSSLDLVAARDQLMRTNDAIAEAAGRPPELFRPPFGRSSVQIDEIGASLGLRKLMWQVDPYDLRDPDPRLIADAILSAHDGAVVLLHDAHGPRHELLAGVRLALAEAGSETVNAADVGQSQTLRVNPQIVHETIDGETILIHMGTGTYYSVDGAGSEAWEHIAAGRAPAAVVSAMQDRHPDQRGAVAEDLRELFGTLVREGALEPAEGPEVPDAAGIARSNGGGAWVKPVLHRYTDMQEFMLVDPLHDVDAAAGWPHAKAG